MTAEEKVVYLMRLRKVRELLLTSLKTTEELIEAVEKDGEKAVAA